MNERITDAALRLQIPSATLVMGVDRTHLVFPAFDVERKERPPRGNLNTDEHGPRVVGVIVEQSSPDQARRDHFGHSGIERLSIVLPDAQFAELLKLVEQLRRKTETDEAVTIRLDATVDRNGSITHLARNGEPFVVSVTSGTVSIGENEPPSRAGGTKR